MAEKQEDKIKFRMVSTRPLDDVTGEKTPTGSRADRLFDEIKEYLKDYDSLFEKYWKDGKQEIWKKQDSKPDPVPPPLTLTVMAPRGGGKTSVLMRTKKRLEKEKEEKKKYREIVWIEVSPWHLREETPQGFPIADTVYPFVGGIIKDNAEKTKKDKEGEYTCLQQKNPSDDNDLKEAKKSLEKAEESLKKAEALFKSAAFLCIRREEAAQAAVAFSDDTNDYVTNFSEKLSSLAAWNQFKKDLRKWACVTRKPLFFLVDDLDLTPGGSMVPLLRAIASIRDSLDDIVPVITVVAADGERLRKELLQEYMRDTDTTKQPRRDLSTGSEPRWSEIRNLQWALAGREFPIAPWIPTYRIRFLAMPKPIDSLDGRLVWAWYLDSWDKKEQEPKNEELIKKYKELVWKFTLLETIGAVESGYGNEENSWDAWKEILAGNNSEDQEKKKKEFMEKYDKIDRNGLKREIIIIETLDENTVSGDCFLMQFLSHLFPSNQREAVFFTNFLIQQYNQWKDEERSTDERLRWWMPEMRRARFLTALSCNRWMPDPFARLLWDHFWPLYAGLLQKGWLEIDSKNIITVPWDKKYPDYIAPEIVELIEALPYTDKREKKAKLTLLKLWMNQMRKLQVIEEGAQESSSS